MLYFFRMLPNKDRGNSGYVDLPWKIAQMSAVGGSGVHVFFFCSGFGLFLSYSRKENGFVEFLKRRFFKIYIPYIFVVIISAILPLVLVDIEPLYEGENILTAVLSHVFLFKMFVPELEGSFGEQLWFVSTLFQFYFVFVLLYKIKKRIHNNKAFFAASFVISMVWWILTAFLGIYEERIWGSFFLQYLWEFSLGMCVADYLQQGNDILLRGRYLVVGACLGIGVTVAMVSVGGIFTAFNDVFAMVGYTSLVLLLYILILRFAPMLEKMFDYLSKISYEWYLTHILTIHIVYSLCVEGKAELSTPSQVGVFVLAFGASIFVAGVYSKVWGRR